RRNVGGLCASDTQDTFVLVREDLDEVGPRCCPVFQNPRSARASGKVAMALKQAAHQRYIVLIDEWFQVHAGLIAASRGEVATIVEDISAAAAHAGGEVAARSTDDDHCAVGH